MYIFFLLFGLHGYALIYIIYNISADCIGRSQLLFLYNMLLLIYLYIFLLWRISNVPKCHNGPNFKYINNLALILHWIVTTSTPYIGQYTLDSHALYAILWIEMVSLNSNFNECNKRTLIYISQRRYTSNRVFNDRFKLFFHRRMKWNWSVHL